MRLAREPGGAIKVVLIVKVVIISLDAWFCSASSTTDTEGALALLPNGQQFFIFAVDLLKLS
jgi:hypothetical protein